MMKPLLVLALVAIWTGCSSPMEVAEEVDPIVAFDEGPTCDGNPDPNSLLCDDEGG